MLTATPFYRANLLVLEAHQPEVAGVVDAACVPAGVTPATGRDGSATLMIPAEDGGSIWFGGSSMPSISAAEILAAFVSDGRSASMPGVLTGVEPLVAIKKMPPYAALFVVEEHAWHVKLALHICDYSGPIAAGRIVFIVGENVEARMSEFFETHPGYDPPTRLLVSPQRSPARIAELQRRLENAGQAVLAVCQRFVETCVRRLETRSFDSLPAVPRVAVLSFDVRPASIEQVHRIERALAKLDWPHEGCAPNAPDKCHLAAHLQAIERLSADLVLLINGSGAGISSLLPSGLPVVSWYLPGAGVVPTTEAEPPAGHMVFASFRSQDEGSGAHGPEGRGVRYCEPAADDHAYFPIDPSCKGTTAQSLDAAILMDLPDDRPQACDVTLASHLLFWKVLRDIVAKNIDEYNGAQAGDLVDRAQRASGVTLADPAIREHFANLVRIRIAPACRGRAATHAVAATGCRFAAWGLNWHSVLDNHVRFQSPTEPRASARAETRLQTGGTIARDYADEQDLWRGAIPVGKELNELFNMTRVVVLPDFSATALQTALDALAAGAQVSCHAPDEPFEQTYPTLRPLARYLYLYRTTGELGDTLSRLTSQSGIAADEADTARTIVLAKHCVSHRLQTIVDQVRAHKVSAVAASPSN